MAEMVVRIRRRAWHAWYRGRWLLWGRRQSGRVRIRRVAGLELVVLPGLLDPGWFLSSDLLADALAALVRPSDRVLDLGTGTGIGALVAARVGAGVIVSTDIDPVAIRCTTANVAIARAEQRVRVMEGDLFEPVGTERFDLVAFNPPWLDDATTGLDRALRLDQAVADRFARELRDHLAPGGRALLILSTNGHPEAWLGPLRVAGHRLERWQDRDRGSEVLTAWLVTPRGDPGRQVVEA